MKNLLRSIARGQFNISGLRNKTLRRHLPDKNSGQVSRLLKRLRLHGLIKKVGHTYKYYLTQLGKTVIALPASNSENSSSFRNWPSALLRSSIFCQLRTEYKCRGAKDQIDVNGLRRQVAFDRLLARLFRKEPAPRALKGGYAMELRLKASRSTVDIDLTSQRVPTGATKSSDTNRLVREMLQSAACYPLGDWFEYTIGLPIMDLTAAPYGGARYPVEARMGARTFPRFHLDVGMGDVVMQPLDTIICRDWLGFAGIESSQVWMIAREQQLAEKIHAYTLPRNTANSRVKDLADLALLIGSVGLDAQRILDALRLTFEGRRTHDLPKGLVPPPADWQIPFQALAEECGLSTDVAAVFAGVQEFLEEVLGRRTER